MSYAVTLFVHLTGVITMFVGVGTLIFAVLAMRRARSVAEVRAIVVPLTIGRRMGFEWISVIDLVVIVGVLLIALSGVSMASQIHTFSAAWVRVATVAFLLIAPLGPFVVNPRLHVIARTAAAPPAAPLDDMLAARTHSVVLAVALTLMAAVLLAIVFLMTNKPSLYWSIAIVAGAAILAVLTGLSLEYFLRRRSTS